MASHSIIFDISHYLSQNAHLGYGMAMMFAMLESIAVVGSLLPGAITMTAIGILVGSGVLLFTPVLLLSVGGALIGDYISYYLGIIYQDRLATIWPISKFPHWIDKGRGFFKKWGVAAIVIGRFFGPVRSMMPLIAGMMNMPRKQFALGIIPSAVMWSVVYLGPGIMLGAVSTKFPSDVAMEIIIDGLLLIIGFWAIIAIINACQNAIAYRIDWIAEKIWSHFEKNRQLKQLRKTLIDPLHPDEHHALYSLLLCLLFAVGFILVSHSAVYHGWVTRWDKPLHHFAISLGTDSIRHASVIISILAHHTTLNLVALILALFALKERKFWCAGHLIAVNALSSLLIKTSKTFMHISRPDHFTVIKHSFSFPSGHTALFTAFAIFLAQLTCDHRWPKTIRLFVWSSIFMVGLSRLILGVHWFSDVVGGLFLGLVVAKGLSTIYQSKERIKIDPNRLLKQTGFAFLCAAAFTIPNEYHHNLAIVTPPIVEKTIHRNVWWQNTNHFASFRNNRFGLPMAPLNIQIHGDVTLIKRHMLDHGWLSYPAMTNIKTFIKRNDNVDYHLPLFNELHRNKAPVLIMIKPGKNILAFRLWESGTRLKGGGPIYLGTINQVHPGPPHTWMPHLRYIRWKDFHDAIREITETLPKKDKKLIRIPKNKLATRIHWNRQIMLIDWESQMPPIEEKPSSEKTQSEQAAVADVGNKAESKD